MFKVKVIIPKELALDPKRMSRAIDNALDGAALAAKVDLQVPTQTWSSKNKATFIIVKQPGKRIVHTSDKPYIFVDQGTKPHVIRAKNAKTLAFQAHYSPKTSPRWIGSRAGGPSGPMVYTPEVHHPGTEPRLLSQTVAEKWQKELPIILQRSVDSAVS